MHQNMQSILKGPIPTRGHPLTRTPLQHRRLHATDESTPVQGEKKFLEQRNVLHRRTEILGGHGYLDISQTLQPHSRLRSDRRIPIPVCNHRDKGQIDWNTELIHPKHNKPASPTVKRTKSASLLSDTLDHSKRF